MTASSVTQNLLAEKAAKFNADIYSKEFALSMDAEDPLKHLRSKFHIPKICELFNAKSKSEEESIYLCGNSLGLQPKETKQLITEELLKWERRGVQGHFDDSARPWVSIGESIRGDMAKVVGAKENEVVMMNSLTVNLHLLMVSFYRPSGKKTKILLEKQSFPSDHYAVMSQLKFHGYDESHAILVDSDDDVISIINERKDEICLILLPGVQYYTGRCFDMKSITEAGHAADIVVGFDCAHAVGNVILKLNEWGVDFACWCTYKYLNSGPGCIGGAFVHEKHFGKDLNRFLGWWGHKLETRFDMSNEWSPQQDALIYQLSNPPVLECVKVRASLNVFNETSMTELRQKSELIVTYLETLLTHLVSSEKMKIITPKNMADRGCQLSLLFSIDVESVFNFLEENGVVCDLRKPDCIRIAAAPLYNSFEDVYKFATLLGNQMPK